MSKINDLAGGEIATVVVAVGLWLVGSIKVQTLSEASAGGALSETQRSIVGVAEGAIVGLVFACFLFKVVWSAARNRDQRRLDRELDDERDGDVVSGQVQKN